MIFFFTIAKNILSAFSLASGFSVAMLPRTSRVTSRHFNLLNFYFQPYEYSIPGVGFSNFYVRDNRTFCLTGTSDGSSEHSISWNEISMEFLTMGDEILGKGEFGLVQKAMWRDEKNNRVIPVAVKTIKGKSLNIGNRFIFVFSTFLKIVLHVF